MQTGSHPMRAASKALRRARGCDGAGKGGAVGWGVGDLLVNVSMGFVCSGLCWCSSLVSERACADEQLGSGEAKCQMGLSWALVRVYDLMV
jgi:hypothetical protein